MNPAKILTFLATPDQSHIINPSHWDLVGHVCYPEHHEKDYQAKPSQHPAMTSREHDCTIRLRISQNIDSRVKFRVKKTDARYEGLMDASDRVFDDRKS